MKKVWVLRSEGTLFEANIMMIKKKIKASKRGLTFSFDGFGDFKPGEKYRYLLDKSQKKIIIISASKEETGLKISCKRSKGKIKSLFDLRSKQVKEAMNHANYLEIEIMESEIVVSVLTSNSIESKKIIGIDKNVKQMTSISISKKVLKAAGFNDENYYQFNLFDYPGDRPVSHSHTNIGKTDKLKDGKNDLCQILRVISLFSGAGMLDYPFARDRHFKIVYAAEIDPDAARTYSENIGNHIHQQDIRCLNGFDLPEADIIIGGPPCQPYSRENSSKEKRGKYHQEGDMLKEYVRIIKERTPKLFLLENVPQFITDSYGANMQYILKELDMYDITTKLVSDSDVGGYTKRKRTFIIGSQVGKVSIPDLVVRPVKCAGEALLRVDTNWKNYSDVTSPGAETKLRISLVPEGGNWRDLPENLQTKGIHSNMYRRLDRNKPCVTICNWRKYLLSPPRFDNTGYWDRILTVAEAAALSGLDKSFVFFGKLSSMQQQVGNGVPIALGKFVKEIILQVFAAKREEPAMLL